MLYQLIGYILSYYMMIMNDELGKKKVTVDQFKVLSSICIERLRKVKKFCQDSHKL